MATEIPSSTMPAAPNYTGPAQKERATDVGGKDQFMQLLVAQLKNQDPLSPLQPHEFAAQLAQFTQLEELVKVNDGLEKQLESNALTTLAMQTNLGASLIGKQVVTGGDLVAATAGQPTPLLMDVPPGGGTAIATFKDASGAVVATRELGSLRGGRQTVDVEGLPEGVYHYSVEVKGANGVPVAASTFTAGTVDGVHFENGTLMLRMGRIKVPMTQLAEINPGTGAATPAQDTAVQSLRSYFHSLTEQTAP
jgi:flagellar basal-body rod modification protein FlgD